MIRTILVGAALAANKGSAATATLPGVFASPSGLPIMVDGKVTGCGLGRVRHVA